MAAHERLEKMIINHSHGTVKIHTKYNGNLARGCHGQAGRLTDQPPSPSLRCAASRTKTITLAQANPYTSIKHTFIGVLQILEDLTHDKHNVS